ncbi:hypothetical protein D0T84_01250 [Dysgonomonas sp. 521]|uniref:hypothetical protein n=1 Tax=Dysgonomonas sp. 521 TaxID=2302932 RepID=UPI0013D82971|nr:hypothetical protein [Dysgonomonas sp. 521]NDV93543.1 hypothetical protein [Dysgonomonas sp. 521]
MKANQKQIEKGKSIAKQLKTDTLFINDKGEYFTSENRAQLSVNGDKKKYQKLDYSTSFSNENDEAEELAEIKALQSVDEVQAILDLELEGAGRETIIKACEDRIAELKN